MPDFLSTTYTADIPVDETPIAIINSVLQMIEDEGLENFMLSPSFWKKKRSWHPMTIEERKARIAGCGQYVGRTLCSTTGLPIGVPGYCNCWREQDETICLECLGRRAELMKLKVKNVFTVCNPLTPHVGFVEVPYDEGQEIIKGLGKKEYWQGPVGTDDDTHTTLFIDWNRIRDLPGATRLTAKSINEIDYERLAKTPGVHRTSGMLGQPKTSNAGKVKEMVVYIDRDIVTQKIDGDAFKEALYSTMGQQPKTSAEYEAGFKKRMDLYAAYLRRINPKAVTGISYRYRNVDLTCVEWNRYTQVKSQIALAVDMRVAAIPRGTTDLVIH